MELTEILNGLKGIVAPFLAFCEDIIAFFMALPKIAGFSLGIWFIVFGVLGVILGGMSK